MVLTQRTLVVCADQNLTILDCVRACCWSLEISHALCRLCRLLLLRITPQVQALKMMLAARIDPGLLCTWATLATCAE